jgi:uncharacterized membrane protein YcaP (DUF421 family)
MLFLAVIDWHGLFVPTVHPLEVVLRGSVMYLFILALMRVLRRDPGALSTADLLVIVLVADAAQNAMASEYRSLTEGAILVGTIFAWNYGLDWLAFRSRWVHRLLNPKPLLLIKNGRVQRRNLRAELLRESDLAEQLRQQGVEDFGEVKRAFLEPDGHLSVIRYSDEDEDRPPPKKKSTIA